MKVEIRSTQRKIRLNLRRIKRDSLKALSILGLKEAELSILFCSPSRMRSLNLRYRGINRATDVLAFPLYSPGEIPHEGHYLPGDIVINPSQAASQAKEHGLTLGEEIRRLLIHGLLHLIGYDHEKGGHAERRMRAKEREMLERI
ncbi:MAG: rRNA maturation RNase YbeY [Thermodesulfovibrionales bacterium]|nr:rRNA maturation RNase YbeY [Thermodesulfovibrionales bacterium]